MYTICASPPQLVRPHRTYLTPDSSFSPLGPEGPSTPAFPLRPISPENFSFHFNFFVFSSQRYDLQDGGGAAQVFGCCPCAQEVRVQILSSGLGSKVPNFIPFFKKRSCEHHYESFLKFRFCTSI